MKITQTEQELLDLLGMTEDEARSYLFHKGILLDRIECDVCDHKILESLADCAERLREKATLYRVTFTQAMQDVFDLEDQNNSLFNFWVFDATTIHRIVAALIAIKRAGGEV